MCCCYRFEVDWPSIIYRVFGAQGRGCRSTTFHLVQFVLVHLHVDLILLCIRTWIPSSASIEVQMARRFGSSSSASIEVQMARGKWRQDLHTSTEVQIATLSIGRGADICLVSVLREI